MNIISRGGVAVFLLLFSGTGICEQEEAGVQFFIDLGLSRFIFDDNTVSGKSNHVGFTLAAGYKSLIEIGYTDAGTILWNASVEEDGGFTPEDGFYTRTKLFYLRGNVPISKTFSVYGLVGQSKVEIEGTTTTTCFFFCGENFVISTSDYLNKESGVALGAGLQWVTQDKRRVQLQYIDYIYDSESDYSGVYLGYGWMFELPPFN